MLDWCCSARPYYFISLAPAIVLAASRHSINVGGRKEWSKEEIVLVKTIHITYRLPGLKTEPSNL